MKLLRVTCDGFPKMMTLRSMLHSFQFQSSSDLSEEVVCNRWSMYGIVVYYYMSMAYSAALFSWPSTLTLRQLLKAGSRFESIRWIADGWNQRMSQDQRFAKLPGSRRWKIPKPLKWLPNQSFLVGCDSKFTSSMLEMADILGSYGRIGQLNLRTAIMVSWYLTFLKKLPLKYPKC